MTHHSLTRCLYAFRMSWTVACFDTPSILYGSPRVSPAIADGVNWRIIAKRLSSRNACLTNGPTPTTRATSPRVCRSSVIERSIGNIVRDPTGVSSRCGTVWTTTSPIVTGARDVTVPFHSRLPLALSPRSELADILLARILVYLSSSSSSSRYRRRRSLTSTLPGHYGRHHVARLVAPQRTGISRHMGQRANESLTTDSQTTARDEFSCGTCESTRPVAPNAFFFFSFRSRTFQRVLQPVFQTLPWQPRVRSTQPGSPGTWLYHHIEYYNILFHTCHDVTLVNI